MDAKQKVKRSRNGCHKCKKHKIKCDEAKPSCSYCLKTKTTCDYSMKLTWGGRPFKNTKKRSAANMAGSAGSTHIEPTTVQFVVNQNTVRISNAKPRFDEPTYTNGGKRRNIKKEVEKDVPSFSTRNGESVLTLFEQTRYETLEDLKSTATVDFRERALEGFDRKQYFPYLQTRSILVISQIAQIEHTSQIAHDQHHNQGHIRQNREIHHQPVSHINHDLLSPISEPVTQEVTHQLTNPLTNPSLAETFNNFIPSKNIDFHQNLQDISSEHTSKSPLDFLNDYSEDLARIETYMPDGVSNYSGDIFSPSNSFNQLFGFNKRIIQVSEDEDSDDEFEMELDEEHSMSRSSLVNILSPNDAFSCIPQPLLLPLPDVLLQVPFYRNLMHFWVNIASHHFVPAPSETYRDNPFKVILPQMATSHPAILTSLLAFSAKLRVQLLGEEVNRNAVIEQLLARSFTELLLLLKDKEKATSDTTLATVLLLACYEVFDTNDFEKHRAHAIGARQIIKVRHMNMTKSSFKSNGSPPESDITFFLMRWFVYMDIIGAISASKVSTNYLSPEEVKLRGDISGMMANIHESDFDITKNDPKKDIDHLLGFDAKLLPHLANIASLISETDQFLETPGADVKALPIAIVVKALEEKDNLTKEYEKGEEKRKQKLDAIIDDTIQQKKQSSSVYSPPNLHSLYHHNKILRCTNKMFYDMGMICLYRRVLRVPRESPIVQELANGIGYALRDNIESTTPAEICTIFCMFTAACETLDTDLQKFFDDRFTNLRAMGNLNALKGQQIMRRCWKTGQDWVDASKSLNIDIAIM